MSVPARLRVLGAFAALLPLTGGVGCSIGCTLIGCPSGITVRLEPPPSSPYRVEARSAPEDARYVATCSAPALCATAGVFFRDFLPQSLLVEVIVGADTLRGQILGPIPYEDHRPNGERCGIACRTATVTMGVTGS